MIDYKHKTDEQLIRELRAGDKQIIDYIMEKYKYMVRQKAKAMYLLGGENDDLIQEGMIGLFKAIKDFNPDYGRAFSGFAELCVERQMYSAIEASKRKKHIPLNSYISIYEAEQCESGEGKQYLPLVDVMEAEKESNPEELLLGKEQMEHLESALKENLSSLESRVLYLQLQGIDYQTIARLIDKSPKAVDNALQRIRTKAAQIMEHAGKK